MEQKSVSCFAQCILVLGRSCLRFNILCIPHLCIKEAREACFSKRRKWSINLDPIGSSPRPKLSPRCPKRPQPQRLSLQTSLQARVVLSLERIWVLQSSTSYGEQTKQASVHWSLQETCFKSLLQGPASKISDWNGRNRRAKGESLLKNENFGLRKL